jgi:hypothetical protein
MEFEMKTIRYLFDNPSLTVADIVREGIATAMLMGIVVGMSVMIMGAM